MTTKIIKIAKACEKVHEAEKEDALWQKYDGERAGGIERGKEGQRQGNRGEKREE